MRGKMCFVLSSFIQGLFFVFFLWRMKEFSRHFSKTRWHCPGLAVQLLVHWTRKPSWRWHAYYQHIVFLTVLHIRADSISVHWFSWLCRFETFWNTPESKWIQTPCVYARARIHLHKEAKATWCSGRWSACVFLSVFFPLTSRAV